MLDLQVIPRDYQIEGAEFLVKHKKAILADSMGVGKTGTSAIAWRKTNLRGPALLVARPNAQAVWIQQAAQWGIQTPYIVSGNPQQRKSQWADVDYTAFYCCTIETLRNDLRSGIAPKGWGTVFLEEAHRYSNRKAYPYKTAKQLVCEYLWLITGSPARKGFQDLWSLLNLCDSKGFTSYWRFIQTFGYTQLDEMGHWEILGLRDRYALLNRIKHVFIRREKKDVLPELPPKQRILDRRIHQLQPNQQRLYDEMYSELIMNLSNEDIMVAQNELVKLMRLRQILCCPKIVDPDCSEHGANLEYLGEMLEDETDDHHFVIYTPFTDAIQHIHSFINERLPGKHVERFQGGLHPLELIERTKRFRENEGVAIVSISYAESFELTPAKWGYFNGFDWSIVANTQAEDRQHRMTTTTQVDYYYPMHVGRVDLDLMAPVLDENSDRVGMIYRTHRELRNALLRQRQKED